MELLRPKEVKSKYKLSQTTLIDLEKKELLHPVRTQGKHRRYDKEEIESLLKSQGMPSEKIGCIYNIYFHNFETLSSTVHILGCTGPNSIGCRWVDNRDINEIVFDSRDPDSYYTVGKYEPSYGNRVYENGEWVTRFHPRHNYLFSSRSRFDVVLKGTKNTGVFKSTDKYCNYSRDDNGVISLSVKDIVEYLGEKHFSSFEEPQELPVMFMSQEFNEEISGLRVVVYEFTGEAWQN